MDCYYIKCKVVAWGRLEQPPRAPRPLPPPMWQSNTIIIILIKKVARLPCLFVRVVRDDHIYVYMNDKVMCVGDEGRCRGLLRSGLAALM